jgi:hypothetical protein
MPSRQCDPVRRRYGDRTAALYAPPRAGPAWTAQHLTAGPELLGVHSQRTDIDHQRERPGARESAPGQPGLRRDTRPGSAVIDARLHHDVCTTGQPQTEHHRDLL